MQNSIRSLKESNTLKNLFLTIEKQVPLHILENAKRSKSQSKQNYLNLYYKLN